MSDIVELKHPVAKEQLIKAAADDCILQCSRNLSADDYHLLNDFFNKHPDILLRVYKAYGSKWTFNLEFLALLSSVRHLHIDANSGDLNDFQQLSYLPEDLQSLCIDTLAAFSDKKLDRLKQNTQVLERFKSLKSLILCGKLNNLDFLTVMQQLERLELWRNGLKTLSGIEQAKNLKQLKLFSSGAKDLSILSNLSKLESLEIWNQRNLTDWSDLAQLKNLKKLHFVSCGKNLPMVSLRDFSNLSVLIVDKLSQASDLELIAQAPNLKCLILSIERELLHTDAFTALDGHPALVELRLDEGSKEFWASVSERYGWKVVYANHPADEYL